MGTIPAYITKTLFVEFCQNPHIARWHMHDKKVYDDIIAKLYGGIDGLAASKAVDEQYISLLAQGTADGICDVEKMPRTLQDWYQSYHQKTCQAWKTHPPFLYQAGVVYDGVFVKHDILAYDSHTGQYDLCEIKAKTTLKKKNDQEIYDDILADLSIQHYVLKHLFPQEYSSRVHIIYLQKEYVKQGTIQPNNLFMQEDVTAFLRDDAKVAAILATMKEVLALSREDFLKRYPYAGEDHLIYFGQPAAPGSIWTIPQSKDARAALWSAGKTTIGDLTPADTDQYLLPSHESTKAATYVSLWQQGETVIQKDILKEHMSVLSFPLYFYDYETISWPVPLLDGTKPRQQVVVQYSCHTMNADGSIMHTQDIIRAGETTNERVVRSWMNQIAQQKEQGGTYIVWYKGFENARNDEIAQQYPGYADLCAFVYEHTFDLMEVFSNLLYMDRRFHGSASLKKVLPVITSLSYDDLLISDGLQAAQVLHRLITEKIPFDKQQAATEALKTYCTQDTYAMIAIYQALQRAI